MMAKRKLQSVKQKVVTSGHTEKYAGKKKEENQMEKFYCVFVEGSGSTVHRHFTLEEAHKEAERLADKTGQKVVTLMAIQYCFAEERPIHWDEIE